VGLFSFLRRGLCGFSHKGFKSRVESLVSVWLDTINYPLHYVERCIKFTNSRVSLSQSLSAVILQDVVIQIGFEKRIRPLSKNL
jgi:hypothetical protein